MTSSAAVNTITRLGTRARASVFRTSKHIARASPARAGGFSFADSRCLALANSLTGSRTVFIFLSAEASPANYEFREPACRVVIGHHNVRNLNTDAFVPNGRSQPRIPRIEHYIIQKIMVTARNP